MLRFYFHIIDGNSTLEDREGVILPGARAALHEAQDAARELLAQKVAKGDIIDGQEFHVTDDLNKRLFVLPFKDVLRFK